MNSGPYDDIIDLPHHVSAIHPQMSSVNRAAQFSPFAALTGYDAAIVEAARLTNERMELSEYMIDALNSKLSMLADVISDHPKVTITYFRADERKSGGTYVTVTGAVKRIDDYEHVLLLMNGDKIMIEDILDIECELFADIV